jgi:hypothetical protein
MRGLDYPVFDGLHAVMLRDLVCQTGIMAIITGGVIEERGKPKLALLEVMQQVRRFRPRQSDQDYAVDIAFRSWDPRRAPEFTGVQAAMVGRKQRRFVVWHSVPTGLDTADAVRSWLSGVLPETARLVRVHLPTKSKAYPAAELAMEIDQLRDVLASGAALSPREHGN